MKPGPAKAAVLALAPGHPFHRRRVVKMRLDYPAFLVEIAPVRRGHQHRDSALGANLVDEGLELRGEEIVRSLARLGVYLLVVVSEFHQHIVPRLHQGEDLVQPAGGHETVRPLPALGIVCHCHACIEEPGEHLPPARPRLIVLVHDGGVSAEKDRSDPGSRFDAYRLHCGSLAAHFYVQTPVPVELADFPLLEPDLSDLNTVLADLRIALVYDKADRPRLPPCGAEVVDREAAALHLDESRAGPLPASYLHRHQIVAVRHGDIEGERGLCGSVVAVHRRPSGRICADSHQRRKKE